MSDRPTSITAAASERLGRYPSSWDLLAETSRTFYLSIRKLPNNVGRVLCLAYLLLRVSDFFEDSAALMPQAKLAWLRSWSAALGGAPLDSDWGNRVAEIGAQEVDAVAAENAEMILSEFEALDPAIREPVRRHVRDSTEGMIRWIKRGPQVETEADLDNYMHEVAGRVGYLSTEVFTWGSPAIAKRKNDLMRLAREAGLALQTVNVLRGIRKDYQRGWMYIPDEFLNDAGIRSEQLFDPAYHRQALQVVNRIANKAERHLQSAIAYAQTIPRSEHRIRRACVWPFLFAAATVGISRNNAEVLYSEAKITRRHIRRIVLVTSAFGWSNRFLDWYFTRLVLYNQGGHAP